MLNESTPFFEDLTKTKNFETIFSKISETFDKNESARSLSLKMKLIKKYKKKSQEAQKFTDL